MTFTNETNENEIIDTMALIVQHRLDFAKLKLKTSALEDPKYTISRQWIRPWYLHGAGGTGKTYSIKAIYELYGSDIKVCTTTNVTRGMLNDMGVPTATVHSLFGIRIEDSITNTGKSDVYSTLPEMSSVYVEALKTKLMGAKVIILDECSMLGKAEVALVIEACKEAAVTIIFSGDHTQLPPVKSVVFDYTSISNQLLLVKNYRASSVLQPIVNRARTKAKQGQLWPEVLKEVHYSALPKEFMYDPNMAYVARNNKPVIALSNKVLDYAAERNMNVKVSFFKLPIFKPALKSLKTFFYSISPIYKEEVRLTNISYDIGHNPPPYKLSIMDLIELVVKGNANLNISYYSNKRGAGVYWGGEAQPVRLDMDSDTGKKYTLYNSFNYDEYEVFNRLRSNKRVLTMYRNHIICLNDFYDSCMNESGYIYKDITRYTNSLVNVHTEVGFWASKWGQTGKGGSWNTHTEVLDYIKTINRGTGKPQDKLPIVPNLIANYSYMLEYGNTYICAYNSLEERSGDPTSGHKEWIALRLFLVNRVLNNVLGQALKEKLAIRDKFSIYKFIVETSEELAGKGCSITSYDAIGRKMLANSTLYNEEYCPIRKYTDKYKKQVTDAFNKNFTKYSKPEFKQFWGNLGGLMRLLHSTIIEYEDLCYVRSSRVSTIHKMQGRSSKIVFINPKGLRAELAYVAISRAEQEVYLLNQGATNE